MVFNSCLLAINLLYKVFMFYFQFVAPIVDMVVFVCMVGEGDVPPGCGGHGTLQCAAPEL